MKKKYEKPFALVELFQLNAATAASCSSQKYIAIGFSEDTCTFDNGQFFNYNNCQVDLTGDENDGNDTICYHGPVVSNGMIFVAS